MNWLIVSSFIASLALALPPVYSAPADEKVAVDEVIRPAITWLKERQWNHGWGLETPRVLLALLRNNDSDVAVAEDGNRVPTLQGDLLIQRFDIALLTYILKTKEKGDPSPHSEPDMPGSSLAHYALTLAALCRNPKDIYGHNIIRPLVSSNSQSAISPFTFAYNVLAICVGGGDITRADLLKLLEMSRYRDGDASQTYSYYHIDLLSIVTMTLACLYQSNSKYLYLRYQMESPLKYIASKQLSDGSFEGNLATTALAVQALNIPESTDLNFTLASSGTVRGADKAVAWFKTKQLPDGSFGNIFTTSEVLMALSRRGYPSFNYKKCPNCPKGGIVETEMAPVVDEPELIEFTFMLWIGQNRSETYALDLKVPVNTSLYEAMLLAAELDPNYQFSTNIWPNGHYITTIGVHTEQYIGFHHWLLFRLPAKPDPFNPPEPVVPNVASGGVDDLFPQNGEFFLFWFKDI